jgi:hypothetical protein
MVQQGLQSTKHQPPADDNDPDVSPTQEEGNIKTNNLFVTMIPTSEFYKSYSDQTGKFPVKSSRGNQYVYVFYNYDSNSIHSRAIKDRRSESIKEVWEETHNLLNNSGFLSKLHILDNECSTTLKQAFNEN